MTIAKADIEAELLANKNTLRWANTQIKKLWKQDAAVLAPLRHAQGHFPKFVKNKILFADCNGNVVLGYYTTKLSKEQKRQTAVIQASLRPLVKARDSATLKIWSLDHLMKAYYPKA